MFASRPFSTRAALRVWVRISGLVWPYSGFFRLFVSVCRFDSKFEDSPFEESPRQRRKPPRESITGTGAHGFSDRRVAKAVPRPLWDLQALGIEQPNRIFKRIFTFASEKFSPFAIVTSGEEKNRAKDEKKSFLLIALMFWVPNEDKIIFLRTLSVELIVSDKLLWFISEGPSSKPKEHAQGEPIQEFFIAIKIFNKKKETKDGWMYIKRQSRRWRRRVCNFFFLFRWWLLCVTRPRWWRWRKPLLLCRKAILRWCSCDITHGFSLSQHMTPVMVLTNSGQRLHKNRRRDWVWLIYQLFEMGNRARNCFFGAPRIVGEIRKLTKTWDRFFSERFGCGHARLISNISQFSGKHCVFES